MHINDTVQPSPYTIGQLGERYIKQLLLGKKYSIYKSNIRKWGLEMDLIAYKFSLTYNTLEVRVVEVKTRSTLYTNQWSYFDMPNKIRRYKRILYDIGPQIQDMLTQRGDIEKQAFVYIKYHLDLAIVGFQKESRTLHLQKYIQNVNLLI